MTAICIGTAGWSIPRDVAAAFPAEGTALQRYAATLPVVEINSSFHRPHRASTWERWGASVPPDFRFAAKVPKTMTHQAKLAECAELTARFIGEVSALGQKLAVLLVQLPPKLAFDDSLAGRFFEELAGLAPAQIVCEPRHDSWFTAESDALLESLHVSRVAADPARCNGAGEPGGWRGFSYWRLHGSPIMYRSSYSDRLGHYAPALQAEADAGRETWCVFDNTASSAAMGDALALQRSLAAGEET